MTGHASSRDPLSGGHYNGGTIGWYANQVAAGRCNIGLPRPVRGAVAGQGSHPGSSAPSSAGKGIGQFRWVSGDPTGSDRSGPPSRCEAGRRRAHRAGHKMIQHPAVGPVSVDCDVLTDGDAELKIVIVTSAQNTEDEKD